MNFFSGIETLLTSLVEAGTTCMEILSESGDNDNNKESNLEHHRQMPAIVVRQGQYLTFATSTSWPFTVNFVPDIGRSWGGLAEAEPELEEIHNKVLSQNDDCRESQHDPSSLHVYPLQVSPTLQVQRAITENNENKDRYSEGEF